MLSLLHYVECCGVTTLAEKNMEQYRLMTETPVSRLIIRLGIPTTISMLVTNIYNMADTYFVGTLGTSASGAVGVVFGLMAIIQACGFTFGHGAGSIISRRLGAKDNGTANLVASASFFSAIVVGGIITTLGLLLSDPFLRLLGSTDTILPFARSYAFWILLASPLMTASFVLNNILRYEGKAALAMIGLTSGGLLNILGDWLFIRKMGMGIEGAGMATAFSQVISFSILLSMFLCKKTQSRISIKYLKGGIPHLKDIVATGFPSLMRQGLSSVATMLLNNLSGGYGDAAVAAMTIVNRICFFIFAVGLGIGQGYQPVCSFNYGAKKYNRVKKGFMFTWITGEILLSMLAVCGMALSGSLVGIFRDDPVVIEIGTFALRAQLISLFFMPLSICANMTYQSVGKNKGATFLSALRSGLVFIPAMYILSRVMGLTGIQISQTVTDVITFFVSVPFMVSFFRELPKEDVKE